MSLQTVETRGEYRIAAYKRLMQSGAANEFNAAPCLREEADCWRVERKVGPQRWAPIETKATEGEALRVLQNLAPAHKLEVTHYGYSMPRN